MLFSRYLLITYFCIMAPLYAGDLNYQIGLESGFLKERQESTQTMLRLIGRFRYDHRFNLDHLNIKLRLAPEGYFSETRSSVLRSSAQVLYRMPCGNSQWDFLLSSRHYTYSLLEDNKQNYMFIIGGASYQGHVNIRTTIRTDLQLIYRVIDGVHSHRLTGIRVIPKFNYSLISDYLLQSGLYVEPFEITSGESLNNGWRIGGSLAFKKRQNPMFSFNYRLLFNKDSFQNDFMSEQHFEILIGNPVSKNWSIIFYANYYLLPVISRQTPIELVYTPLNTQNWVYLQTGFDVTRKTEIYTRAGYIYEEVNYGLQTIQGWQILLGLNLTN